MEEIQKHLFELQDMAYRDFHSRLMPDTDKETVIGIRVPVLRKYAKSIAGTELSEKFIKELPHHYYEENNLHMMLITRIKDYDKCLSEVERFLSYIDNWATCDFPAPKCFEKHKEELLPVIKRWIASSETYTIRYGIGMLMRLYLDEDFEPEYVKLVAGVLCQHDDSVVHGYSSGKAVGCGNSVHRRTPHVRLGSQKDNTEGCGELPHN